VAAGLLVVWLIVSCLRNETGTPLCFVFLLSLFHLLLLKNMFDLYFRNINSTQILFNFYF
jgi:hypothetical protein